MTHKYDFVYKWYPNLGVISNVGHIPKDIMTLDHPYQYLKMCSETVFMIWND